MAGSRNLVFFGTPDWAVPSLDALLESEWTILGVVTNPDRPAGRGYELRPPPVKVRALDAGLDVMQPERVRDPDFIEWLRAMNADVCAVVAYGKILPLDVLEVPPLGFVNLHFSLLPAYRGAAPVQRAVMDGARDTGVSIMRLTEGMDEGPVLRAREVAIEPEESAGELGMRLAEIGGPLLAQTLSDLADGTVTPIEQDHAAATYAPKITSEEARIDWSRPAQRIVDLVRGLHPAPGAWTTLGDKRVKVHRALMAEGSGTPGEVIDTVSLTVAAGSGAVVLDVVQPAGKKPMTGAEMARGLHPHLTEHFE